MRKKIPGDSTYRVHSRIREPGAVPQPAPRSPPRPFGVLLRLLRGDRQLDTGSKHTRGERAAAAVPGADRGGAIAAGAAAGPTERVPGSHRRGTPQAAVATNRQAFTGISNRYNTFPSSATLSLFAFACRGKQLASSLRQLLALLACLLACFRVLRSSVLLQLTLD